ncbi:hypothetical protein V6N13_127949 [Hibiscus sabdariffa]
MVCREETAGGDRPTWPIEGKWWEDKSFHLWICCSSVFNSLSCPVLNLVGESRGLSSSVWTSKVVAYSCRRCYESRMRNRRIRLEIFVLLIQQ